MNCTIQVIVLILTGTPAGKRPLGRQRRRWEDNIRMNPKEMDINTRNWVDLAQDNYIMESPCKFGIETWGFISHGVS